jgi:hypothetical protein
VRSSGYGCGFLLALRRLTPPFGRRTTSPAAHASAPRTTAAAAPRRRLRPRNPYKRPILPALGSFPSFRAFFNSPPRRALLILARPQMASARVSRWLGSPARPWHYRLLAGCAPGRRAGAAPPRLPRCGQPCGRAMSAASGGRPWGCRGRFRKGSHMSRCSSCGIQGCMLLARPCRCCLSCWQARYACPACPAHGLGPILGASAAHRPAA